VPDRLITAFEYAQDVALFYFVGHGQISPDDRLAADERPVPHSRAVNDARDFAIAYNVASPEGQHDAEQELTRLSQRLAATDAQVQGLAVQAAERERELARLQQVLAAAGSRDTEGQRELQDAIDATAHELHETRAAQAALTADSSAASEPAPDAQSAPRRPSRRRFLIAGGAIGVLAAAGGGVAAALAAMPHSGGHSPGVVAGRKAFVFITSQDHFIYALDAVSGKKIWAYATGNWVYSSPVISGGVLYVGSDDEKVYALDAATGSVN
jgi:PQQ-like domain